MRIITRGKKPKPWGATHLLCMKYVHVWQQSRKPAGSWFAGQLYSQGIEPEMGVLPV